MTTKDEALKLSLEALEKIHRDPKGWWNCHVEITAVREALTPGTGWASEAKEQPAQVSPLEFVTMTLEKEHLVGRPIIWAQWPNEEKNT